MSPIEHLTLVHDDDSRVFNLDAQTTIALPRALRSLQFYFNDCDLFPQEEKPKPLSNAEMWSLLKQQQASINHLDIYRAGTGTIPPTHSRSNGYFGSLRAFECLRTLCIQPEVLLGGCCDDLVSPFRLKDILPFSLESLTFYGDEGLVDNEDLGKQLQEVMESVDFPYLRTLVLEEVSHLVRYYTRRIQLPHQDLGRLCKEKAIGFRIEDDKDLQKGGHNLPLFKDAFQMRRDREKSFWRQERRVYKENHTSEEELVSDDESDSDDELDIDDELDSDDELGAD